MQGFSLSRSGLSAARVLFTGAALLASGHSGCAQEMTEDTAMAIPRVGRPSGSGVALPQPLSPSEAARIAHILALQAQGRAEQAAVETDQLTDGLLLGHILAARYLLPGAQPTTKALQSWLTGYRDLPDSGAISVALATRQKRPLDPAVAPTMATPDEANPLDRALNRSPALDRTVRDWAHAGENAKAVRLIARTPGMQPLYGAALRAEVAQILFTQGQDGAALALAEGAHRQAGGRIGLAPYVAGLAAWRLGHADLARAWFDAAAQAPLAPATLRTGASFWGARAHLRTHDLNGYGPRMRRAAQDTHTFYGLLARRMLGLTLAAPSEPDRDTLGEADVDAVAATPGGLRAFGLVQVGEYRRAAAELRALWTATQHQPGMARSILLVARAAGLDALTAEMTPWVQAAAGRPWELAHLPSHKLRPTGGFRIDPALVYALARLESNFDAGAISPAGARGLMQITPVTAGWVMGSNAGNVARSLTDPATNLDLGQRYLLQLADYDLVQHDLIRLLASYNSGPSSFARWADTVEDGGDPLLFLESIPTDETRRYVPRALVLSWLYAAQLHTQATSLDELAAGVWPRLTEYAASRREVAGRLH